MTLVKKGEISIEEAVDIAKKAPPAPTQTHTQWYCEDSQALQYNFSVYKFRYRWQKRILQIDFVAKIIYNIEKGIIKKQFSFSQIKSYEDGERLRFSITFQDRQDYELEATSSDDKTKIMQLIHKIVQSNIYMSPVKSSSSPFKALDKSDVIREGQLELQKGGLASVKWMKYFAQLHKGELSLQNTEHSEGNLNSSPIANVIHLSDGNVSVNKQNGCSTFTVQTRKNNYLFRVPITDQSSITEDVKDVRDKWVTAIDECCLYWKDQLQSEPKNEDGLYTFISFEQPKKILKSINELKEPTLPVDNEAKTVPSLNLPTATPLSPPVSPVQISSTSPATVPVIPSVLPMTEPAPAQLPSLPLPVKPIPHPAPPPLPVLTTRTSKKTKAFHWDIVPQDKVQKSVWGHCNPEKVKLDVIRLYNYFKIQEKGTATGNDIPATQQTLLNQKVAHNFSIFLKSFPTKPNQMKDKLLIIHEEKGGLTDEHIASLRRYIPTPGDIDMYKSFKGSPSELHLVDQYMLEMCKIPYLNNRLDLLLKIREFPGNMHDLQPLIKQQIKACTQLSDSKNFISVLEYLLAIGNYLNENAGKQKAKGFRLSSLTKLLQLCGKERQFTLLYALVEQILLHEPELAKFSQELTEFEAVAGASIKGLNAEVEVLKNELQKITQYKKNLKSNRSTQELQFSKDLKAVIQKYEADLSQLTQQCGEMKKIYSDILIKFGEPQDQDSQELFGWVSSFIKDFKKVYAQIM
ncbi:formin-F [Latimeria chalumnae]|uniref:formin-F n=1 Tax=Latimeria chalumnae TaxID=7897 RepID=UPI0006D90D48|nr:PREDICTED: formin-F-like isoform X2 [Latimeria chalumnae]|eukprot:XP_014340822.1 PREDICTED: formin-F-like isoform X2 [Latimeria chalumnae]